MITVRDPVEIALAALLIDAVNLQTFEKAG